MLGETSGGAVALFVSGRPQCGKTLLADELAWSLERTDIPFAFETLPTGGTDPVHPPTRSRGARVLILDACGSLGELEASKEIMAASAVVIPVANGTETVRSLEEYISPAKRLVEAVRIVNPRAAILLVHNRNIRGKIGDNATKFIADALPDVRVCSIEESDDIQLARQERLSSVEAYAGKRSAVQILRAVNAVRICLALSAETMGSVSAFQNAGRARMQARKPRRTR